MGLAGCGGIARQYHLRELSADPRVELVAVADPSTASRAALPTLPGVEVSKDVEDMIGSPGIDAVVVCASTPAHAEIAAGVAEGHQHLYLEKPIALDLDEARRIEALLDARDALTAVGFQYRFSPAFRDLKQQIGEGRIGAIRHVRAWHCEVADPGAMSGWKLARSSGGGVLIDIGSHEVDFASWLLGTEVDGVEDATLTSSRIEHDDARFVLRMSDGVRVEVVVSYVQGRKHRWEVEGSDGVLRAERWPPRVSRPRRPAPSGPTKLATRLRALPVPRREPSFGLALRQFARASQGEPHSLPTIADGRRSLEIVLEAERDALAR
ncbi:MAG: myo-inositol 2-dehydrogenase / D-chiro-inositol 1-dehydrogenase [Solirubrobacterales bacterium]|nr:myo-inositol 2-dehydrogenase / D-chiro-inositol 1-dehydrogenase [Solirubrobacterales bacterium]